MKTKKSKYVFETFHRYQYCGYEYIWVWPNIEVEVNDEYVDGVLDTTSMREKASKLIAKEIARSLSIYKNSDWKYIHNIDFKKVKEKSYEIYESAGMSSTKKVKTKKKKPEPILEFVDLFGETRQILSDKSTRIKPIYKGE